MGNYLNRWLRYQQYCLVLERFCGERVTGEGVKSSKFTVKQRRKRPFCPPPRIAFICVMDITNFGNLDWESSLGRHDQSARQDPSSDSRSPEALSPRSDRGNYSPRIGEGGFATRGSDSFGPA